ncbi:RidA family protein [Candidatus Gracilibacteria bacterium]|nr:RidA family protein [Candidatus Gracilibacteria bacterium]
MSYSKRLAERGIVLEAVELDNGKFVRAVQAGTLAYTAGHVSRWNGQEIKGKLGSDLTVAEGYAAARLSTLACLEALHTLLGALDTIERVVKVLGMVNVASDFDDTPAVMHGCSELLLDIFGDAGKHARSAVGMVLPYNYAVEIEMIVMLKGGALK